VDFPNDMSKLQKRLVTPGAFFYAACDGKFTDEDLSKEGNRYVGDYFEFDKGQYIKDYETVLGADVPDLYQIEDTWANFDRLKPLLDQRFREWKARHG